MNIRSTLTALLLVGLAGAATADDDNSGFSLSWSKHGKPGIAVADNPVYREECGSCHLAYPPGFLPPQSWERLMATLDDHFGENAELPEPERRQVLNYLLDNAAGRNEYRLSAKMIRGVRGTPLRISELPGFRREHDEIPARMVGGNPEVRSFSNCENCHTRAAQGSYREREVVIPGYGRYED